MSREMQRDMLKFGITLLLFCAIGGGSLAFTYAATRPQIEAQAKLEEEKACKIVMPGAEFKRRDDLIKIAEAQFPEQMGQGAGKVFDGLKGGKVVGSIIQLASKGYGGPILMAVGIHDGKVTGFTVIDHRETAGLGSGIRDDLKFGAQFIGKTAKDPLEVKKDVVAITGATKSSKGAASGVKAALEIYGKIYGGVAK